MFSKDLPSGILFNMSHTKRYKEIRGPSLLSFVRNVRHNPVLYCYDLMKQYGDVVRCPSIRDIYLVSNPVLANKIFMNSQKLFDKKNFINKRLGEVMGEGLVVSTGAKWKKQRKAAEVIYKKEYLQELTPAILHYTDQMMEAWKLKAAKQTVNVSDDIRDLVMKIMAESMFPLRDERLLQELKENFLIGNKYVSDPTPFNLPAWVPMSAKEKLNKAIKNIDNVIIGMMNARCSTEKYEGKLLANIMDQKGDDGRAISREDAMAEIKNVFISSFFSTSDLLSWLVYSLAQYPCWADKIYYNCELFKEKPDPRSLDNCLDMQLFIHEVLRFYSPAWASSHRTLDPLDLEEYIIPKHVTVLVSIYNLHRHPTFWDQPEIFNPERFRSFHEQREKAMFIPFGLGPRKCVGMGLATLVINIVCAKIVCNFNLSVDEKAVPAIQSRVSLGSKDDLEVFISPR